MDRGLLHYYGLLSCILRGKRRHFSLQLQADHQRKLVGTYLGASWTYSPKVCYFFKQIKLSSVSLDRYCLDSACGKVDEVTALDRKFDLFKHNLN
eukprot:SAG31_NODE_658_length_13104_cov_4.409919_17_plen_95_part_00